MGACVQLAVFRPGSYQVTDYLLSWTYPDLSSLHDARPGPPLVSVSSVIDAAVASMAPVICKPAPMESKMYQIYYSAICRWALIGVC